jgi:maltooligosyltrehalose trehalohydrolase
MTVKEGGFGFDAQWLDDFQHAVFALITGESEGYYKDYGKMEDLIEVLNEGYLYIGDENNYKRRNSQESYRWIPANRFIVFSQNHDQIGNRLLGDRLTTIAGFEAAKLAAGIVILSPYVPLLFMGEEYGETTPFLFFTDYQDKELANSIVEGRRKEFASFHWKGKIPNPQNPVTFNNSKINWDMRYESSGKKTAEYYRALINLRKRYSLFKCKPDRQIKRISNRDSLLFIHRIHDDNEAGLIANCAREPATYDFPFEEGVYVKILDSADFQWNGSGPTLPTLAIKGDEHVIGGLTLAVFLKESKEGKPLD